MKIPLTQGKFAIIDDEDYPLISSYKWYYDQIGYAATNLSRKKFGKQSHHTLRMHVLLLGKKNGYEIDHVNKNGLDNRRINIRLCRHAENIHNAKMRKDNTSGYFGVKRNGRNWCAQIWNNMKQINLGTYKTKTEAALAYNQAALKYHGEFAKLNKCI